VQEARQCRAGQADLFVASEQVTEMRDVEVVILATCTAESVQALNQCRSGAIDRRSPPVAMDDRRDACGEKATAQALNLTMTDSQQLGSVRSGELACD
jgi:hypothetical protein